MKSYYIDADEKIQVDRAVNGRVKKDGRHFTSEQEWTRMAAGLPMARMVAIWNALPGVTPVERFTSRARAAKRIWKAIGRLEANGGIVTSQATAQPEQRVNKRPARAARGSQRHLRETPEPPNSKKAQMVALLKRDQGASIDQLVLITGWQKHSVRGFLSGTMRKKLGLRIVSSRNEGGARIYRIAD
jgi:hypothetical protein